MYIYSYARCLGAVPGALTSRCWLEIRGLDHNICQLTPSRIRVVGRVLPAHFVHMYAAATTITVYIKYVREL